MHYRFVNPAAPIDSTDSRLVRALRTLARSIGVSVCVGVTISVLVNTFRGNQVTFQDLLHPFLFSLVYSQTIGTMMHLTVPPLWPWFARQTPTVRWPVLVLLLLALAVIGSMAGAAFLELIGVLPPSEYWKEFAISVRISVVITLIFGGSGTAFEVMRSKLEETTLQLRTNELERERALKLATEARLSSLESRIHPHFLFNTLNSISSLIREDPVRAERLIERMAALLRFSLDASESGSVTLDRELKIVEDYLEIEKARFGHRLQYAIHVPAGLLSCETPPLSIQTIVENAVKYGVAPRRNGGKILISGATSHGNLEITVSDDGPGFTSADFPRGHGLDNLQARLQTQFGTGAGLSVQRDGEYTRVVLTAPQNELARRVAAAV